MLPNIFNDVLLKIVANSMSKAGKSALDNINNLNTNVIQEQLKNLGIETQNILSSNSEVITNNFRQIISEILPAIDVSTFNNYVQDTYDNMPDDTEVNLTENEANIIENIYSCVESYNEKSNTEFKIKIPSNKKKIYVISLVSIILVILRCLDYDIIEHFSSIFDGFFGSFVFEIFKTIITEKAVE